MEPRICTCGNEVHPCYLGSKCEDCLALVMNEGHKVKERMADRAMRWQPPRKGKVEADGAR